MAAATTEESKHQDLSFDDMKAEFLSMDQEIKEKANEIVRLQAKLKEREQVATKMVDQMEELHENLAELDIRFERSETLNKTLRSEKEDAVRDTEDEVEEMKKNMGTMQNELTTVRNEYQEYRNETDNKLEHLRDSFKTSIESAKYPITQYLEKNKGSKTPMKKTKGYKLLKSIDNDLKNILSQTTNNNS